MALKKHPKSGRKSRPAVLPLDLTDQLMKRLQLLTPSLKTDYLQTEVLSKYVSEETDPPLTRRTRAINKWLAAERDNEATNHRLLTTMAEYNILPRVTYEAFIDRCRTIIGDIIGDTPPTEALIGSFSGGASTSRCRTKSHPASKYLGEAHATRRCLDVWTLLGEEIPGWLRDDISLTIKEVPGNVLFTVPKKTDIDRVACKEPDLNMFIQKGIGAFIRKALKKQNINLNDQSINRSLAHRGSVTGDLATLDLSSASDSITTGLTDLLLPEVWFTLLDSVRSPVTIIDGEEHSNEMFSSMGNGFTFELESLLFYSIARTVAYFRGVSGVISVYGDDIICPVQMAHDLTFVLNYLGFQVNTEKSFYDGPFRESCGGHYHSGLDITPFYIKKPIKETADLIDVANKLRKWGTFTCQFTGYSHPVIDPEIEDIWLWLKSYIPDVLWGGGDTTFKYQLASLDVPQKRIAPENKVVSTGEGGYYHWLNATWTRIEAYDGLETSSLSVDQNRSRFRTVRDKTVPQLPSQFLHEIVGYPSLS